MGGLIALLMNKDVQTYNILIGKTTTPSVFS